MSMLVARMQKMKANNLAGIERHNKRIYKNHSNEDIDGELSNSNYDLMDRQGKYADIVKEIIDSQKKGNRAIRSDAVLVNEWIITSDKEFFRDMAPKERDRFFQEATNWFKERYGQQNIAYAQVHLDERTPHMHLGVVPMREGKLSAKNVFNRQELRAVQDELPKHLQEKGFEIQRGKEESERKHLSVPEYKEAKEEAKKVKEETKELASKASQLAEFHNNVNDRVKTLVERNKALEGEIERKKALVKEHVRRVDVLVSEVKQEKEPKRYHAAKSEPIYQPEVRTELLRGRTVKMSSEEYNKMLASQRKLEKDHENVVKNFNVLADLYYHSEKEKQCLVAELAKANKAIPVQNEFFVPAFELQKAQQEIREKDKLIEQKNRIIGEQAEQIKGMEKAIMRCAEFIRDMRKQAYDLVSDLAKRMGIVPLVNNLIHQEKEQQKEQKKQQKRLEIEVADRKPEPPKKQKSRADDWGMER
uniref:Mob/Pre n=2 Tax=Heyndrickxia TaxID=2837504 RepID=Q9EZA9_HEYCO|nr:Mob/Pre [Heyndrickxia coagulans]